jgi:hypothetical protein
MASFFIKPFPYVQKMGKNAMGNIPTFKNAQMGNSNSGNSSNSSNSNNNNSNSNSNNGFEPNLDFDLALMGTMEMTEQADITNSQYQNDLAIQNDYGFAPLSQDSQIFNQEYSVSFFTLKTTKCSLTTFTE